MVVTSFTAVLRTRPGLPIRSEPQVASPAIQLPRRGGA
jgi:hypothetical protein